MYKFVAVLALAICAQAYNPGVAFPEDFRSDSRIIDGSPADPGQIPYQGFLIVTKVLGLKTACGASLISPDWVLTAAHCISSSRSADVHLGSVTHADSPVIITSTNLVVHPDYSILGIRNDIGLIGLPTPAPLSDNIQPIALPTDPSVTYAGREAVVSGFGLTADGGAVSPVLYFAPVRVITNLVCLASYPLNVRDTVICTRGVDNEAQGTCNGDSGGPLVLTEGGVLKQIGIVSFGRANGCTDPAPKGFVRPYHYIPWITEVTGLSFE